MENNTINNRKKHENQFPDQLVRNENSYTTPIEIFNELSINFVILGNRPVQIKLINSVNHIKNVSKVFFFWFDVRELEILNIIKIK